MTRSERCFLAPCVNAIVDGDRGALYWGRKDRAKLRRFERAEMVIVEETGETVAGLTEYRAALTAKGIAAVNGVSAAFEVTR